LLPGRLPEVALPEVADLLEIKTMLAESVVEWTQEWKQQGLDEGRKEGRKEGLREGESLLLARQLVKRFGPLDEQTLARLAVAGREQLELWGERILDARQLSEVFDDK
jgi:flagellar biosynthesis/type III secretory pathway protein FliH